MPDINDIFRSFFTVWIIVLYVCQSVEKYMSLFYFYMGSTICFLKTIFQFLNIILLVIDIDSCLQSEISLSISLIYQQSLGVEIYLTHLSIVFLLL